MPNIQYAVNTNEFSFWYGDFQALKNLTFNIKPMGFKHTGIFPEQAVNWDWMMDKIQNEIKTTNREYTFNCGLFKISHNHRKYNK